MSVKALNVRRNLCVKRPRLSKKKGGTPSFFLWLMISKGEGEKDRQRYDEPTVVECRGERGEYLE